MKTLSLLFLLTLALMGCSKKEEAAAPPPPAMKMNGQNVPSEGAHYMQQMKQGQGQQAPNGGR
jgi:hypothetical protein